MTEHKFVDASKRGKGKETERRGKFKADPLAEQPTDCKQLKKLIAKWENCRIQLIDIQVRRSGRGYDVISEDEHGFRSSYVDMPAVERDVRKVLEQIKEMKLIEKSVEIGLVVKCYDKIVKTYEEMEWLAKKSNVGELVLHVGEYVSFHDYQYEVFMYACLEG
ncbi:MAG: hypothetical protein ABIH99_02100 [Candidatus Micrarchaeota archaeon]